MQGGEETFEPQLVRTETEGPVRVHFMALTERQKRRVTEAITKEIGKEPGQMTGEDISKPMAWHEQLIRDHVRQIDGYTFRGCVIDTPDKLLEYGEGMTVADIANTIYYRAFLTEDEKKRLHGPFASTPPMIPASNGTAASADGRGSPRPATASAQIATQDSNTSQATG